MSEEFNKAPIYNSDGEDSSSSSLSGSTFCTYGSNSEIDKLEIMYDNFENSKNAKDELTIKNSPPLESRERFYNNNSKLRLKKIAPSPSEVKNKIRENSYSRLNGDYKRTSDYNVDSYKLRAIEEENINKLENNHHFYSNNRKRYFNNKRDYLKHPAKSRDFKDYQNHLNSQSTPKPAFEPRVFERAEELSSPVPNPFANSFRDSFKLNFAEEAEVDVCTESPLLRDKRPLLGQSEVEKPSIFAPQNPNNSIFSTKTTTSNIFVTDNRPLKIFDNLCHRYFLAECCLVSSCQLSHIFPGNFESAIQNVDLNVLLQAYDWVKGTPLFKCTLKSFVNVLSLRGKNVELAEMVLDVFEQHWMVHVEGVQLIVKGLQDTGMSFQRAIEFLLSRHGNKNVKLTNCLLEIITDESKQFSQNWYLVERLLAFRTEPLHFIVVNNMIGCVLSDVQPNLAFIRGIYDNVIAKNLVDLRYIPKFLYETFIGFLSLEMKIR